MTIETMRSRLLKLYYRGVVAPAIVLAALLCARLTGAITPSGTALGNRLGPILFISAIVLAVAMPILLRTLFASRWRLAQHTPPKAFYFLQRRLLWVSLATVYLLPAICLVRIPNFYQGGIILAALYGVYYHYPSRRRIAFDCRVFRVRDDNTASKNQR